MRQSILLSAMLLLALRCDAQLGCPRVFPSSVHLYLPATLPPGPYPYVHDSATVWISCDSAPPFGMPFDVKVIGSSLVGIEWTHGVALRASDTTWQNLKVGALSRAIDPALSNEEALIEITAGGQVAKLSVSVTITDAPFVKLSDATIYMGDVDALVKSALWFPNARTTLPFTLVPENSGWLATSLSGGSGYTSFDVNKASIDLPGGEHFANLTVTSPAAVNSPLQVPVRLFHAMGGLWPTPASLAATVFITQTAPRQKTLDLFLDSTSHSSIPFTIESDAGFLSASPPSGVTPAHIAVTADGASFPLGTIRGNLNIYSPASTSLTIPVTLTVAAGNSLALAPNELNFFTWPGKFVRDLDSPTLTITSTRPLTAKVEAPAWLSPSLPPSAITTPKNLQFSIRWELLNPNPAPPIPAGKFTGVITVSSDEASNSPQQTAVNAYSLAAAPLKLSPESVSFSGSAPPPQTVSVTGPDPTAFTVSVPPRSSTWLSVSPTSATTPAILTFTQKTPKPAGTPNPEIVTLYATQPGMPPVPVYVAVF